MGGGGGGGGGGRDGVLPTAVGTYMIYMFSSAFLTVRPFCRLVNRPTSLSVA